MCVCTRHTAPLFFSLLRVNLHERVDDEIKTLEIMACCLEARSCYAFLSTNLSTQFDNADEDQMSPNSPMMQRRSMQAADAGATALSHLIFPSGSVTVRDDVRIDIG